MKRIVTVVVAALAALIATSLWAGPPAGAPPGRYTIGADTVTDNKTGLTWQRVAPAGSYTWTDAKTYCQQLSLGGFTSGWRLPTKKELETLVDDCASSPAIDANAFPAMSGGAFWTSTPWAGSSGSAWSVDFGLGASYSDDTSLTYGARCVR